MKRFAVTLFLLSVFACNSPASEDKIEILSPEAAANQLQSNPEIIVIDVRTPEEMQSGFIAGAKNIDFNAPGFQNSIDSLDHAKTYLVYCAIGKRSAKAQQIMKDKGFEHILSVDGGLNAWAAKGLPVAKP